MPANGTGFTLPALTPVSFSLTDGTNIPPPPDSPISETPPSLPLEQKTNTPAPLNGTISRGRTMENPPLSPASTSRPSSIRRFLSRKSLHTNYNGDNMSSEDLSSSRPDSPSSFMSGRPSLGKKKSGSWFSKIGGKRTSVVYEKSPPLSTEQLERKGPPPPKLPELNQLKAKVVDEDGGLGGGEMFKGIGGQ